jgi:hypothetical protein
MSLLELSEILGNFGEFVGAILVGASLIYLAIQVRHNTVSTDEANMRAEVERIAGFCAITIGTPGFMEIYLRAQKGEELTHVERAKFNTHMFAMFIEFRLEYKLHKHRPSSNLSFETNNRNNMSYLSRPGGREWWEHQKEWLGEQDFIDFVDGQLAEKSSKPENL